MAFKLLDVNRFLQQMDAKAVINPRTFNSQMEPSATGLQSQSIFGVSTNEKFSNWGFINLEDVVMHPLVYDNLNEIDATFKRVLNKKKTFKIVNGMLEETKGDGDNGVGWLIANWDKINFDKYRKEKNKIYIDFIKNTKKHMLFVNKVPVIPIVYREARMDSFRPEEDEVDKLYKKILSFSKTGRSDFTSTFMETIKDKNAKDFTQEAVNELYKYFISRLDSKYGFVRGNLTGKRLDNVSRLVANSRPDIPVNSAVIPWQALINLFDVFVVAFLENEENEEYREKLGLGEISHTGYGDLFDYIYRNVEIYTKHYPGKKEVWIEILVKIFNDNPMLRIMIKRDPGWNADSLWVLAPLINSENMYNIWIPNWTYSPLGGDSFNTNFYIDYKDDEVIYEDEEYKITGTYKKARIVRTMDSVWKKLKGGRE